MSLMSRSALGFTQTLDLWPILEIISKVSEVSKWRVLTGCSCSILPARSYWRNGLFWDLISNRIRSKHESAYPWQILHSTVDMSGIVSAARRKLGSAFSLPFGLVHVDFV